MDMFKPQREIPQPRCISQAGIFGPPPSLHPHKNAVNISNTTTVANENTTSTSTLLCSDPFYTQHPTYLPTDFPQRLITQHHFNQQVSIAIPTPSTSVGVDTAALLETSPYFLALQQQLYQTLTQTYVYHVECDLSLLLREPFYSTYIAPSSLKNTQTSHNIGDDKISTNTLKSNDNDVMNDDITTTTTPINTTNSSEKKQKQKQTQKLQQQQQRQQQQQKQQQQSFYAIATHATPNGNSFNIINNTIAFSLDKDTYQSLGITGFKYEQFGSIYKFRLAIGPSNITRLREILSALHVNKLSFLMYSMKNNHTIPIDFGLLQRTNEAFKVDAQHKIGSMPCFMKPTPILSVFDKNGENLATNSGQFSINYKRVHYKFLSQHTNPTAIKDKMNNPSQSTSTGINTDNIILSSITPQSTNHASLTTWTTIPHDDELKQHNITTQQQATIAIAQKLSSNFPILLSETVGKCIKEMYVYKKSADTENTWAKSNNLLTQVAKKNYKKNAKRAKIYQSKRSGLVVQSDDGSDDSDADEEFLDGKYVSQFVQALRQETYIKPFLFTPLYQMYINQMQLYFSLLYTNNLAYMSNAMKLKPNTSSNSLSSLSKDSYLIGVENKMVLDVPQYPFPSLLFLNNPTSTHNSHITITIRGFIPICVIVHLFKHLRVLFHKFNTENNPLSQLPFITMTTYGIPTAICAFEEKLHAHSQGFGGDGESNYTIVLTKTPDFLQPQNNDVDDDGGKKKNKIVNTFQDSYLALYNVDFHSKVL